MQTERRNAPVHVWRVRDQHDGGSHDPYPWNYSVDPDGDRDGDSYDYGSAATMPEAVTLALDALSRCNYDLVEHLRHTHGFRDYEPGGEGHEPNAMGFALPLDQWTDDELDDWHAMDHADYPEGGGGPHKHDHHPGPDSIVKRATP